MGLRELEVRGILFFVPSEVEGIVFTTRLGGVSNHPFELLNLGYATGDRVERVATNRALVAKALDIRQEWITGRQVHAAHVLVGGSKDAGGPPPRPEADAVVTSETDVPVAVLAADCVPIALVGERRIGAVHAGWRGMCAGVIGNAMSKVGRGASAWLGPSIGPCHYEVGEELPEAFRKSHPHAPEFSKTVNGSIRFDLRAAARWLLDQAGARIVDPGEPFCTACDSRFYSFRRDGRTGRQALLVWKTGGE